MLSVNTALCARSFVHHGRLPPASRAMLMIHMLMSVTLSYGAAAGATVIPPIHFDLPAFPTHCPDLLRLHAPLSLISVFPLFEERLHNSGRSNARKSSINWTEKKKPSQAEPNDFYFNIYNHFLDLFVKCSIKSKLLSLVLE